MDERIYELFHLCLGSNGGKVKIFPNAKRFFPYLPDIFERKALFVADDNDPYPLDAVLLTYQDIKELKTLNDLSFPLNSARKVVLLQNRKEFFHLKKENFFCGKFANVEQYGILPSMRNPRWIIPLKNAKVASASLNIYQPSLFITRLVKKCVQLFLKANGKGCLPFDKLYLFSDEDSCFARDLLKETLPATSFFISIFTGTPGYYRKVTFQVMDRTGETLAYYKIGETSQSRQLIENEAQALSFLATLNLATVKVPHILVFKKQEHRSLLGQSACPKPFWLNNFSIKSHQSAFFEEIYSKTSSSNSSPLQKLDCFKRVKERVDRTFPSLQADWKVRLETGMEKIRNYVPKTLVFSHGDFTPWNTNIKDEDLYIFDWEFATFNELPLMDLFHFYYQPAVLLKKQKSNEIVDFVLNKINADVKKMPFLLNYLGKHPYKLEIRTLFLYYLLRMASLFLPTEGQSVPSPKDLKYINDFGYAIDIVLSEQ